MFVLIVVQITTHSQKSADVENVNPRYPYDYLLPNSNLI